MNKTIIALSLLVVSHSSFSMLEISGQSVMKRNGTSNASLFHDGKNFQVKQLGVLKEVANDRLDKNLRNINTETLRKHLTANHYLTLNKSNDGEYSVQDNGRVNGGGPLLAKFIYVAVKGVAYGVMGLFARRTAQAIGATIDTRTGTGSEAPSFGVTAAQMAVYGSAAFGAAQVTTAAGTGVAAAGTAILTVLPEATQVAITTGALPILAGPLAVVTGGIEAAACGASAYAFTLPTP